uniref:60S ribosomal export protein NMD3 n=1 Tax=Globisporangium ultimum (strain ATCC 200006 / CBS 805.95 / DAOM BR144) TaxID=431595 RepID=K3WWT8_GLOUD
MAISCCICGTSIEPNAMNMCKSCIASETDVADGIELDAELTQCKGCLRFQPRGKGQQNSSVSGAWIDCDWESAELMALCLKSVHGLQKAKLMDAGFIWTEPHSKRVKVKLTLQREVLNHAVIQNSCVVTYTVKSVQCPDCMKKYHNNTWRSLVQIRQKADHKRTFLRLEQVILKHKAHQNAIGIATVKEGMDFYFGTKSTAEKFIHFLTAHVPMRSKSSSKLISENVHNATANLQTTYSIELSPICRDDLLILPKKFAQSCGNISPIVLCARTTAMIHLVDPRTGQKSELSSDKYWKVPFLPLETSPAMTEFIVLDVEPVDERDYKNKSQQQQHQHQDSKFMVADVEVARASDFGVNDTTFIIRTHLGALLQAGDTVKGYDLTTSNFGTRYTYSLKEDELPDIVLVRKVYPREAQAGKKEKKLKTLGTFRRAKISKSEQARLEKELDAFTEEYLEELEEERENGDDYVELDDDSDYDGEDDGEDDDEDEEDQEEDLGYTQTIEVLSLE